MIGRSHVSDDMVALLCDIFAVAEVARADVTFGEESFDFATTKLTLVHLKGNEKETVIFINSRCKYIII